MYRRKKGGFDAPAATGVNLTRAAPYAVTGFFKFFTRPERPSVLVKITLEDAGVATRRRETRGFERSHFDREARPSNESAA